MLINQKPAGYKKPCGCNEDCLCDIPPKKSMKPTGANVSGLRGFSIEAPEYKGNCCLNAPKS